MCTCVYMTCIFLSGFRLVIITKSVVRYFNRGWVICILVTHAVMQSSKIQGERSKCITTSLNVVLLVFPRTVWYCWFYLVFCWCRFVIGWCYFSVSTKHSYTITGDDRICWYQCWIQTLLLIVLGHRSVQCVWTSWGNEGSLPLTLLPISSTNDGNSLFSTDMPILL